MRKNVKRILEKIYPKSLLHKCCLMILIAMLGVMVILHCLLVQWVYAKIKPDLLKNYVTQTSDVATRISYLLHQNSQFIRTAMDDEELTEKISAVLDLQGEKRTDPIEELAAQFPEEHRGTAEPGALVSNRYLIVLADGEDWICPEGLDGYAEKIEESAWLKGLTEYLDYLNRKYPGRRIKSYSPVLGDAETFVVVAETQFLGDHELTYFMVEPFSDYQAVFETFRESQITEYGIIGDYPIYESTGTLNMQEEGFWGNTFENTGEMINLPADDFLYYLWADTDEFVANKQYEVKQTELDESVLFGVRISYAFENLKLLVCVPNSVYLSSYITFIQIINAILFLLLGLLLLLILLILKSNFSRLSVLSGQMQDMGKNVEKVDHLVKGQDEIGILASNFYQMIEQIRDNLEQIETQKKRKKDIEYSLLISQVDPHFIYNTLDTITYLAEEQRYEDIIVVNKAIIEILRNCLNMSKLQIYDSLENEKQQLKNYVTIQNYLCGNRVRLKFEGEDLDIQFPKNILQPLVENSIFHGILPHRNENGEKLDGTVIVRITADEKWIYTEIRDDGTGMSEEELEQFFQTLPEEFGDFGENSARHTGIGIHNIRMRLAYLYGDKVQLSAASGEHGGVTIRLTFPKTVKNT